ncbi:MAG: ligand-binding protein SH3 [Candidatus Omnitrophica bacterium]|nr:ligand-binding protein SH3 [Candidatus Omnitrophota bacterium]
MEWIRTELFEAVTGTFSPPVAVTVSAMLPVFELRLAVPLGILQFRLPVWEVYTLAVVGNLVPVLPLLFFLSFFFHGVQQVPVFGRLFRWWFERVERKSQRVRRWGFWGLVLMVAIPLPMTGAWTGCAAAALLEVPLRRAVAAITLGVLCAGAAVTLLSVGAGGIVTRWFLPN